MARNYFNVEVYGITGWHSLLEARYANRSYAEGYYNAMLSRYPCPPIRIVNSKTKEVIKEHKGRSSPHLN